MARVKILVNVEDASTAPLRGEDKYLHLLLVLGLMEPRLEKNAGPVTENSLLLLSSDRPPTCSE